MNSPPNQRSADASNDDASLQINSLVPLIQPVNTAEWFTFDPQILDEGLLHKIFHSEKACAEDFRRWNQTFRAPRKQFTIIGLQVFDAVFQDYAALLETQWKSPIYLEALKALRCSLLQFRQAQDKEPLLIAHVHAFAVKSCATVPSHSPSAHEGEA